MNNAIGLHFFIQVVIVLSAAIMLFICGPYFTIIKTCLRDILDIWTRSLQNSRNIFNIYLLGAKMYVFINFNYLSMILSG